MVSASFAGIPLRFIPAYDRYNLHLPLYGILPMNLRVLLLGFALIGVFIPTAQAEDAGDRLKSYLKNVQSLTARFDQVVLDQEGGEIQRASGRLSLQRPSRFRWDYREPYTQLIVSDGETFWIYDEELEQVTVKPLDKAIARTPAMVLSSDRPVEQDYEIKDLGERRGLAWVALIPKVRDTDYDRVRLGFEGEALRVMELVDGFGQVTRLSFSDWEHNPRIDAAEFSFVPPRGVDVIEGR